LSRLPAYHLRRPRLTDRVAEASVGVVVGGAGYGKSILAAEACDFHDRGTWSAIFTDQVP
jgi:ATP/maltotriose-dependent transcriptional regulator MalT